MVNGTSFGFIPTTNDCAIRQSSLGNLRTDTHDPGAGWQGHATSGSRSLTNLALVDVISIHVAYSHFL